MQIMRSAQVLDKLQFGAIALITISLLRKFLLRECLLRKWLLRQEYSP